MSEIYDKFPKLKAVWDKLNAKRDELRAVFDAAGPDLDMDKVTSLSGDSKAKTEWIAARNDEVVALKAEHDKLIKVAQAAEFAASNPDAAENSDGTTNVDPLRPRAVKSLGRTFIESKAFTGMVPGGQGPMATLDIDIRNTLFQTSAGWSPESVRTGVVSLFPTRPAPHVTNFIPFLPTSQAAVKYMEETTFTNSAAEAAEGAAYGESALVLTERSQTVEKIAVWLPVTDEQIEDVAGIEAYVDQRLRFMIQQRLDSQVLVGNGTTPNILGTENVTGIQTQALGTDPIPDAIYKLFRAIRDDGFAEPSVVFIRPAKWETIRLLRTADGIYIWGHPSVPGPFTIWGVPIVETTAVTATKAVAGDYAVHANFYLRRGLDVQVTNAHSTFFINGKQAVRADMRGAMVTIRPKAFGEVSGL